MARGKRKPTIIQVKSAPENCSGALNLVKLSSKVNENVFKPEMLSKVVSLSPDFDEKETGRTSDLATKETAQDYVHAMQQISPHQEDKKKIIADKFIEVHLKTSGAAENAADILEPELMIVGHAVGGVKEEIETKKEKRKKKKKKKLKKNKVSPGLETTEQKKDVKSHTKLQPVEKTDSKDDNEKKEVCALKNVGCFGFISTWLAKRKEKRREKKRRAIQARKTKSSESLVVYEHRRAKGGVAFTVEVDSRPMKKSVLPPISQRPGPIRMRIDQKLESAENNRTDHINKKREAACAHSRLVREVADRRAQNEENFKQATLDKIREKDDSAFRAMSRLEYARNKRCQSRCTSRMASAPNMFPNDTALAPPFRLPPLTRDDDVLTERSTEPENNHTVS